MIEEWQQLLPALSHLHSFYLHSDRTLALSFSRASSFPSFFPLSFSRFTLQLLALLFIHSLASPGQTASPSSTTCTSIVASSSCNFQHLHKHTNRKAKVQRCQRFTSRTSRAFCSCTYRKRSRFRALLHVNVVVDWKFTIVLSICKMQAAAVANIWIAVFSNNEWKHSKPRSDTDPSTWPFTSSRACDHLLVLPLSSSRPSVSLLLFLRFLIRFFFRLFSRFTFPTLIQLIIRFHSLCSMPLEQGLLLFAFWLARAGIDGDGGMRRRNEIVVLGFFGGRRSWRRRRRRGLVGSVMATATSTITESR